MNDLIEILRQSGTTIQALGVTAGGLIGVFVTLGAFFLIIWLADRFGTRRGAD